VAPLHCLRNSAERTVAVLGAHHYLDRAVFVGFDWPGLIHAKKIAPDAKFWFTTMPKSWFADGSPPPEDDPPSEPALQVLRYWAREGNSPWAAGFDAAQVRRLDPSRQLLLRGGDGWFPMWVDATDDAISEAHAPRSSRLGCGRSTIRLGCARSPEQGIDAICTDRPDVMMGIIGGG